MNNIMSNPIFKSWVNPFDIHDLKRARHGSVCWLENTGSLRHRAVSKAVEQQRENWLGQPPTGRQFQITFWILSCFTTAAPRAYYKRRWMRVGKNTCYPTALFGAAAKHGDDERPPGKERPGQVHIWISCRWLMLPERRVSAVRCIPHIKSLTPSA